MKKGFTLIELAIVLIIVGLLTGGILVAKSMILTAKINKLVADIGRYEIAVNNFYMNYKQYPGDSIYFTPPGNGDDEIGFGANGINDMCAAVPNGALSNFESYQGWAHLSQAHMLDVKYVPYSPTSCPGGTHSGDIYDQSLAGVVFPYTESEKGIFGGRKKIPLVSFKGPGMNFGFQMYFTVEYSYAMEAKMNGKDYDYTNLQTGLVNTRGKGNCVDGNFGTVSCESPGALHSEIRYYIPPI